MARAAGGLTLRELECMRWVADGKTDWEIGKILSISQSTVRFHLDRARLKLDAKTRPQAVARLVLQGLYRSPSRLSFSDAPQHVLDMRDRGVGQDAVPEIEDQRALAEVLQDAVDRAIERRAAGA